MADCSTGDPRDWGATLTDRSDSIGGNSYWAAPNTFLPPQPAPFIINSPQITERIIERVIERPEEVKAMRGLFDVYIVDPASDEVVATAQKVIAKDKENAKLKAITTIALTTTNTGAKLSKPIDDYDIIVVRLGDVRPKREVQEVKVVTD